MDSNIHYLPLECYGGAVVWHLSKRTYYTHSTFHCYQSVPQTGYWKQWCKKFTYWIISTICIAWMERTLQYYNIWWSLFFSHVKCFFFSPLILFLRLHFCLSSNNPLSPVCFTVCPSHFVDLLSVHATAQCTLFFKQTKHKLYVNKQITSFIFPVGCQTCSGPLLLNCQHSTFHSPHCAYTSPSSLPLLRSHTHTHTHSRHCTGIHKLSQGT